MRLQWIILGLTGVLAIGFIVFLLCKLAFFEGYRPAETGRSHPRSTAAGGGSDGAGSPGTGGLDGKGAETAEVNLRRLLLDFARHPQPARRDRLVGLVRQRIEEFEPHLLDILAKDDDELVVPAIEVAGALRMMTAVLPMVVLSHSDTALIRAAALRNKELLEPWSDEELLRFLDEEKDVHPLGVVLDIVSRRDHRPVATLTRFLAHPLSVIRTAAIAAIPVLPPGPELENLCRYAMSARGEAAWAAAYALGRPGFQRPAELCLVHLLQSDDPMLRQSALGALANKSDVLIDVRPVLAVVEDSGRPLAERVQAVIAMERTLSIPGSRLREIASGSPVVLRVYIARCLAASGDSTSIPMLIDLLDTVESETVQYDDRLFATVEAQALLKDLTGQDLGPASEPWRRWYSANSAIALHKVRRAYPAFW